MDHDDIGFHIVDNDHVLLSRNKICKLQWQVRYTYKYNGGGGGLANFLNEKDGTASQIGWYCSYSHVNYLENDVVVYFPLWFL